ncbi:MAG: GAF domain-containing protein [Janthinobacterium lividum]
MAPTDTTPRKVDGKCWCQQPILRGNMRAPALFPDEDNRLAALREYALASDSMGVELDSIIDLASNLFAVQTVLVSLVERERQIFAARLGLNACETDRSVSFCAHALNQSDVLDAAMDPRFFDNPLVTGGPKIRFYAGAPLTSPSGFGLGSLCIIDTKPHNSFSESDQRNLKDLAALVLDKMELRRLNTARRASQLRFEQIACLPQQVPGMVEAGIPPPTVAPIAVALGRATRAVHIRVLRVATPTGSTDSSFAVHLQAHESNASYKPSRDGTSSTFCIVKPCLCRRTSCRDRTFTDPVRAVVG